MVDTVGTRLVGGDEDCRSQWNGSADLYEVGCAVVG